MINETLQKYFINVSNLIENSNNHNSDEIILELISQDQNLQFMSFYNTSYLIKFLFNLFYSKDVNKIKIIFKQFIENLELKSSKIHLQIVLICIITATYDKNSKNKAEFIDYLSGLFCIDKEFFEKNYDAFVNNFNNILSLPNIYTENNKITILDTAKDINLQLTIIEEFSKSSLYQADNLMNIIVIKYLKIIIRLYLSKYSLLYKKDYNNSILYLLIKFCFFNKLELIDYSLDFIKFTLENYFESVSQISKSNSEFSHLFFNNFNHIMMVELLSLPSKISCNYETLNKFSYYLKNDYKVDKFYNRDICIFYFVYNYNSKLSILKIASKNEMTANYLNSVFPSTFYQNFRLNDMYNFLSSKSSLVHIKDNIYKSVLNLILIMFSEIMKYGLPVEIYLTNFNKNNVFTELEFYSDLHEVKLSLDDSYISNRDYKNLVFFFISK